MFYSSNSAVSDTCTDEGDIRLVGGTIPNEGIVELCAGGHYGHICQDSSSSGNSIGQVTCRQLGFDPSGNLINIFNYLT